MVWMKSKKNKMFGTDYKASKFILIKQLNK